MVISKKPKKNVKDYVFTSETSSSVPEGLTIKVKGNKLHQIEDVEPRQVGGVDLFSKYYHRSQEIYVDKYFNEVIKLYQKEATK